MKKRHNQYTYQEHFYIGKIETSGFVMMHKRITRESKTVEKMIILYCRKHHLVKQLCPECLELVNYAHERLKKCPFQGGKTTCAKCHVHCYNPAKRERIRKIMRYSGPRMLFYHPIASIQHLIDGRRSEPITQPDNRRQ